VVELIQHGEREVRHAYSPSARFRPRWPGLDTFPGRVIYSSEYKNATFFSNSRVLVVGLGNSGGEIAVDLCDAGLEVSVSARSPVNIIPRDLLGIPILPWAILQKSLPYMLVDALNGPVLRLAVGNLERFGLRRPGERPYGASDRRQKDTNLRYRNCRPDSAREDFP